MQVAPEIQQLGPFHSYSDLDPVMPVLQRWVHLLEFDLFRSQVGNGCFASVCKQVAAVSETAAGRV